MRRALTAVMITVVVTVLLVNFKPRPVLTVGAASTPRPAATTPSSGARASSGSSQRTSAKSQTKPRTVIGPAVSTEYGTVQVAVTVSGNQLKDVRALVLPSGNSQTDAINAQAGPMLRQEAMAAQSARIDTISGASYTSEGYQQSLQAALDRAHA
jgi:uncharacterized protein with FMN-binding domain